MLDRAIGLLGLALTLIFGIWSVAPEGWPKLPPLATFAGIAAGIFLIGFAIGLVVGESRTPPVARKAELHLEITGANVFTPDAQPNWTGIGVDARIWNTGEPSIAVGWSMKIRPNGSSEAVTAQLTAMPNVLSATGPYNSARLLASNSLEAKTRNEKIGSQPVDGVLLFYAALPHAVVSSPDTIWEFTVRDMYEKEIHVKKSVGDWLQR